MKKTLLLVLSIICLSCAKNGSQPETLSLNVASESVTKVSLGNDYVTTWNTGDCATVFYRSQLATEWNYVGDDGALCGQLRYVGEPMHNTTDEIVAVVPADDQATLASGVLKTAVASVQKGFAPILVSHTRNSDLYFKYAGALLQLTLKGYGTIERIRLVGNDSEVLCGPVEIDSSDDRPVALLTSDASGREVILESADGGYLAELTGEARRFFFSLPQLTLSKGVMIEVYYSRGSVQKIQYTDEIKLEAGKVFSIEEVLADDELIIELDFSKEAMGFPTTASTSGSYNVNINGTIYNFVCGFCPNADLTKAKYYINTSSSPSYLYVYQNGWYMQLPKIENHELYWFSAVPMRTITENSSTEYYISTDISVSSFVARNFCVSDKLTAPQTEGEEYVAYLQRVDSDKELYLTQYAGGSLHLKTLKFGYKRVK